MTKFKVNEYLTLKLEEGKTNIYIKNEAFRQCKQLKLMELANHESGLITPETKFWGHCSVLQVWAENNYSLDLLDKQFAFLLLKKLRKAGDIIAMKILISLTHCVYCNQELTSDDVYCPNCRKYVLIPHFWKEVNEFIKNAQYEKAIGILKLLLKKDYQDVDVLIPHFWKEAIEFFDNAQFEKAIDLLKLILKENSQDTGALAYLGDSYLRLNQNRKALKIFKKVVTIDPTYTYRKTIYFNIIFLYIQANKFDKAMTFSEELVKKHPEVTEYIVYRGYVHASMGNHIKAKESYDKALEFAGRKKIPYQAFFWLGELLINRCEFTKAIDTITRGLVRYMNNPSLIFIKSKIYIIIGDYDKVMQILIELLRTKPKRTHDSINFLLGHIYLDKGQYYKAIKSVQNIIYSSKFLSTLYNKRRIYHKAIGLCEEAIRFRRDDANAWKLLGRYHANAKELDKAKRAINMALALNPYSNNIKLSRAYIYIKNEEYDNAITICNKILELIPKHFLGRLYMGHAFYGKGNFVKAMEFFKKALEIDANSDKAKYFLAKIYFKQKNYTKALNLTNSRLNPYSRDFFDLVVEIMDEALKSHKICPKCRFLSKKKSNFCPICGLHFEKEG